MRLIISLVASAIMFSAIGPAFAHEGYVANCSNAPRAEWAKCIIDQSQDQGTE